MVMVFREIGNYQVLASFEGLEEILEAEVMELWVFFVDLVLDYYVGGMEIQ